MGLEIEPSILRMARWDKLYHGKRAKRLKTTKAAGPKWYKLSRFGTSPRLRVRRRGRPTRPVAAPGRHMPHEPPCNYCDTGVAGAASGEDGAGGGIVLVGGKLTGEGKNRLGCDCEVWGFRSLPP